MKVCEDCKGLMLALTSDNNPNASEFYCTKCKKSHYMTPTELKTAKVHTLPRPRH